jgi:hypothetical protein
MGKVQSWHLQNFLVICKVMLFKHYSCFTLTVIICEDAPYPNMNMNVTIMIKKYEILTKYSLPPLYVNLL